MVTSVFSLPLIDPVAGPREFLAGEENALVRIAQQAVLEPRPQQLPLLIYGTSGIGKTFLAAGLAELWRTAAPGREVQRLTGVDFARQYANACDTDSINDFRDGFARYGLVLVEGIHTLVEKPRAAREFCFQLDQWLSAGKIVLATSLLSPFDLADAGLSSRLSGGLVLPLALPSAETRNELLAQFAGERSLSLSDELRGSLVERLPGAVTAHPSPRDLAGALLQLESTAELTGCSVDAGLVETLLTPADAGDQVDIRQILAAVAKRFDVTQDELRSSSRRHSLVRARGIVILLARRLTGESLQSLGKLLGKRDHSTIHHALETTVKLVHSDDGLRASIDELQADLRAAGPVEARKKTARRRG